MDAEDYAELAGHWEISMRNRRLSPQTIKCYREGVKGFARWCESQGTEPDLTLQLAERYTVSVLENRAASTARLRQLGIRVFSAWLADRGESDRDDLAGMKAPKLDQQVVDSLTPAQLDALLATCAGKRFIDIRDRAVVMFMSEAAARADEACAMRVYDADVTAGSAVIRKGKGGKGRRVGYGDRCADALARYIRARTKLEREKEPRPAERLDALWLAVTYKPLTYHALYQTLFRRAAKAGIEDFHPHRLRHTAAVRWLDKGGSPLGLKSHGGWSDWDMVERYVGHHAEQLAIREARRLFSE